MGWFDDPVDSVEGVWEGAIYDPETGVVTYEYDQRTTGDGLPIDYWLHPKLNTTTLAMLERLRNGTTKLWTSGSQNHSKSLFRCLQGEAAAALWGLELLLLVLLLTTALRGLELLLQTLLLERTLPKTPSSTELGIVPVETLFQNSGLPL